MFGELLRELRSGRAEQELDDALKVLVQQVGVVGKGGTLTLALKVAPNDEGSVSVEYGVRVKLPEAARGKTIFFADSEHRLSRRDPRQMSLADLKDVEAGFAPGERGIR